MRTSLFWKLFASHLALVLLAALAVGLFATRQADAQAEAATRRFLEGQLGLLEALARPALERPAAAEAPLRERVRDLGTREPARYTVLDEAGHVLADTDEDPRRMENHATRPEVVAARQTGQGAATRFSHTVRKDLVYVARRVDGPAGPLGYVRVSLPVRDVDQARADVRTPILWAALVAIAAGFLVCLLLARRFARPLERLTAAATAVAAGDPAGRIDVSRRDQVGDLARAFDRMARTLRERVETILHERGELASILAGMVEGVVAVDGDGKVVTMNAAAGRILDADPEGARGRTLWEAIPVRAVAERVSQTLAEPAPRETELRVPGPGGERVLQVHTAPLPETPDGPAGALVVLHDITTLRRLERVRRDFVANASHELKTPVAAIRGIVETILEDEAMDPGTRRTFLERAHRQTHRLSALVEEMLALSRLEARPVGTAVEAVDVREAVAEAIEAAQPLAAERRVAVERDLPADPVELAVPREGLLRIVGNLLDNAVELTEADSTVHVRVRAEAAEVVIEVEDAGPGVRPEEREKIFERFYRVDAGRSREVGGTGLGLAIVKHLVLGLSGTVEVEDAPRRGSVFRVRLPRP